MYSGFALSPQETRSSLSRLASILPRRFLELSKCPEWEASHPADPRSSQKRLLIPAVQRLSRDSHEKQLPPQPCPRVDLTSPLHRLSIPPKSVTFLVLGGPCPTSRDSACSSILSCGDFTGCEDQEAAWRLPSSRTRSLPLCSWPCGLCCRV